MFQEPQPCLKWAASMNWGTLQSLSPTTSPPLPTNLYSVTAETVTMIPFQTPKFGLWVNAAIVPTDLTQQISIAGHTFSVTMQGGTQILAEMLVPSMSTDPAPSTASPIVREAAMKCVADGTSNQSNLVRGTVSGGIIADFNGDLYIKLMQQPDPTVKMPHVGQAQSEMNAQIVPGCSYTTRQVRVSPDNWMQPCSSQKIYVICRPSDRVTVLSNIPNTSTEYLYLPSLPGQITLPAYAKPFVDTGDSCMSVFNVYMQLSPQSFSFIAFPQKRSGAYCEMESSITSRLTWLCSVIFYNGKIGQSGPEPVPMFVNGGWAPSIEANAAYFVRGEVYTGLAGNQIIMSAQGKSDIPLGIIGTAYYGEDYSKLPDPRELALMVNEMNDPDCRDSMMKTWTRQWLSMGYSPVNNESINPVIGASARLRITQNSERSQKVRERSRSQEKRSRARSKSRERERESSRKYPRTQ